MLATGCQNLGRLNRKLSEVLSNLELNIESSVSSFRLGVRAGLDWPGMGETVSLAGTGC